ncbi:RNA methyltransferase [Cellulomonas sp.]|uniref:RNA methyltransferase n=1 Tax=Cellulomonas sp. TaxID=40001 RepID=UPI0025BC7C9E|nr:RNA methyltransferase [Cellulomonas sp.]
MLAAEVADVLSPARPPAPVPGRDDALTLRHTGPLADVLRLRTAVAAFVHLHFDVPRPRSLTSGDHLARIVDAVYASLRAGGSSSFRFEAAGSDSAVFRRLADQIREATGLQHDEQDGQLVIRVRRGTSGTSPVPGRARSAGQATGRGGRAQAAGQRGADRSTGAPDPGWDVLVRVGPRPLSARTWRVADYPGAVNATIAAAMVRLGGVEPTDRVLNLMCGSGTLLVERLLAGPAEAAVGVDHAPEALTAAAANLDAASLTRRTTLIEADALAVDLTPAPAQVDESGGSRRDRGLPPTVSTTSTGLGSAALDGGPFDVVYADPPWGTLHGSHATAADVHGGLLRAAHRVTRDGGTFVVLTHEITVMERCLREADALWTPRATVRVFAKGHHPRIYVLGKR